MERETQKLTQFFEQVKTLSFWKRIFGWSEFRSLSYDAHGEFISLLSQISSLSQSNAEAENKILILKNDNDHLKEQGVEISVSKEKINQLQNENSELKKENIIFNQEEENRKIRYESDVNSLNSIKEQIQADRKGELDKRQKDEIDRLNGLKETWANHENNVKEIIKSICQKHTIEYVDKVPFKGSPDNTIKIADEFIIFDAKSPSSDDLGNFPIYIKTQIESVKKYIKEENVKKDIFLVIPSNTVDVIEQSSFSMGDYNVYVITLDALEPIILSLKRIGEFKYINDLSPDERDTIYRVIGRFAHITKRRIQVDQFFAQESLDIVSKSDHELPREALEKVMEYERSEKLNPPQEKRTKLISIKELETDGKKIKKEAEAKEIISLSSIQIET